MDWKLILICVFMVAGFSLSQYMSWRSVNKSWQEAADARKAAEAKAAEDTADVQKVAEAKVVEETAEAGEMIAEAEELSEGMKEEE